MACINPDGTLSVVARRVLSLLRRPHDLPALAAATGLPVWRLRATIRETGHARLIAPAEEAGPDRWALTALGEEALALDAD